MACGLLGSVALAWMLSGLLLGLLAWLPRLELCVQVASIILAESLIKNKEVVGDFQDWWIW